MPRLEALPLLVKGTLVQRRVTHNGLVLFIYTPQSRATMYSENQPRAIDVPILQLQVRSNVERAKHYTTVIFYYYLQGHTKFRYKRASVWPLTAQSDLVQCGSAISDIDIDEWDESPTLIKDTEFIFGSWRFSSIVEKTSKRYLNQVLAGLKLN